MTSFNAEQFLQTRTQGKMSTKYAICPQGEWRGVIDRLDARENEIKTGNRKGETVTILEVTWEILNEDVKRECNMDKVTARQSIFLDFTPEGAIDYGTSKNVALGRLREAVHQDDPLKDWWPNRLLGQIAKVNVEHSPNPRDPESPFANVTRVAPLD